MTIPDYQSLMLPVLMAAADGEIRLGDAVGKLAEQLNVTFYERTQLLPSGKQTTFGNRVHWARAYSIKAGLLKSTRRAHFAITDRGRQILASNPLQIDANFLSQFSEFRQFKEKAADSAAQEGAQPIESAFVSEAKTPDEIMRVAHKQVETSLAQELLDQIRAAPPAFFERVIINLLLGMGYGGTAAEAGRALGRSGDDGVDGVIDQDPLGLDRVYIQAKHYANGNNIGAGAIRDFFGSLDRHKATKGLFVTTSNFSPSARETAEFLSKRIVLIDGEHFARLMIRYNVGCRVEETFHIKRSMRTFLTSDQSPTPPNPTPHPAPSPSASATPPTTGPPRSPQSPVRSPA